VCFQLSGEEIGHLALNYSQRVNHHLLKINVVICAAEMRHSPNKNAVKQGKFGALFPRPKQ
jgi:hypothetical protein